MKFGRESGGGAEFDATDRAILGLLQENCKRSLAATGEKVGLSAPAVVERIHKLEEAGVIRGYVALLDGRRLGRDVTAFIGVATGHPRSIHVLERQVTALDEVLECHHVTGAHTLLVKVKTRNTETLEKLIEQLRSFDGVTSTDTMVALSTAVERPSIALGGEEFEVRPPRRAGGGRPRRATRGGDTR